MKYYNGEKSLLSWSSNNSGINEKDLFHEVTYDRMEMIKSWRIRLLKERADGNTYFSQTISKLIFLVIMYVDSDFVLYFARIS